MADAEARRERCYAWTSSVCGGFSLVSLVSAVIMWSVQLICEYRATRTGRDGGRLLRID
jgi:hypothetical protein